MATTDILERPARPLSLAALVVGGVLIAATVAMLASPLYLYSFVPAFALLALFLLGRYPQFGYYLIVFLVPLDVFRALSENYSALTVSKLVGVWLVAVMVLSRVADRSKESSLQSNLWPLLGLFLAACVASSVLSQYRASTVFSIRQIVTSYIFFGLTLLFASSPQAFSRIIPWTVIVSVSLGSALAVLGFAANLPQFAVNVLPQTQSFKRSTGTATDPNIFSLMVLFALPLIAHMFFSARGMRQRVAMLALFALNVMAIVVTYSRSGVLVMVALIVLMICQYWRRFRARYVGFVMLGLTTAVVAAAVLAPETYWDRVKSTFDTRNPSVKARIGYLRVASDELRRRPILGIGIGGFADAYAKSRYAASSPYRFTAERAHRAAHNTYAEVLVGTGIVGFALFAALLAMALRNYAMALRHAAARGSTEMVSLIKSYRLSLVALLADLLTLSRLSHKYLWIGLALSQAALLLAKKMDETPAHDELPAGQ